MLSPWSRGRPRIHSLAGSARKRVSASAASPSRTRRLDQIHRAGLSPSTKRCAMARFSTLDPSVGERDAVARLRRPALRWPVAGGARLPPLGTEACPPPGSRAADHRSGDGAGLSLPCRCSRAEPGPRHRMVSSACGWKAHGRGGLQGRGDRRRSWRRPNRPPTRWARRPAPPRRQSNRRSSNRRGDSEAGEAAAFPPRSAWTARRPLRRLASRFALLSTRRSARRPVSLPF